MGFETIFQTLCPPLNVLLDLKFGIFLVWPHLDRVVPIDNSNLGKFLFHLWFELRAKVFVFRIGFHIS